MSIWDFTKPDDDYEANQSRRADWFKRIAPADDWKNPIDSWIAESDLENCQQAAVWFTGGLLTIAERKGCCVRVTAPGYYESVGA